jgi:hypothetical protein
MLVIDDIYVKFYMDCFGGVETNLDHLASLEIWLRPPRHPTVGYDLCATTNHPGYISVSAAAASSCSAASTPTLYVRGAQYSGNVYSGTPSACSDITNILTAFSFYALGSAVDVTTFQSASYNYQ